MKDGYYYDVLPFFFFQTQFKQYGFVLQRVCVCMTAFTEDYIFYRRPLVYVYIYI